MSNEWLILFFLVGAIFVGLVLIFSGIVAPKSFNPQKFEPYECGIPTEGVTWLQFNVGYYLFAILFLVFDVARSRTNVLQKKNRYLTYLVEYNIFRHFKINFSTIFLFEFKNNISFLISSVVSMSSWLS